MTDTKKLREFANGYSQKLSCEDIRNAADEIERLRAALKPFADFAQAHYTPDIGLGCESDLGPDYLWLCPSPGYPKITTKCFTKALSAMSPERTEK